MAKKSFKDSARASVASAFMSSHAAQGDTQENAQDVIQKVIQQAEHDVAQEVTQDYTQQHPQDTPQQETLEIRRPIRTQGRKGKKKPRINMAFEPDIYEYVRAEAEREDKSITQCVNDILYQHMKLHKKRHNI